MKAQHFKTYLGGGGGGGGDNLHHVIFFDAKYFAWGSFYLLDFEVDSDKFPQHKSNGDCEIVITP